MLSWRVLYVQGRYEFTVEKQFQKLGITHYVPKLEVERVWSDRVKKLKVPAFPGYVFVNLDEKDRNKVFDAKGVIHYVKYNQRDATIREDEIQLIQNCGSRIQYSSLQEVNWSKGQKVMVTSGVLKGCKGCLVEILGKKTVQIKLEYIPMGFLVELPVDLLEVC
ncbi:MAG: UpxY family transcription antiterminator [Saprospiraceae bacterium]|nr:UpxY family transcription antiterminator [Saprospiraceae bacterium]